MRVLFLHVDFLEYEVTGKALKTIGEIPEARRHGRVEEALVCFISAEKRDEADPKGAALAAAKNIEDVAGQVHTKRIVLYPYAHLSSSLAAPEPAQAVLAALEEELRRRGYDVHASPFGYYKSFKVSVKGHPLSELSREIVAEAQAAGEAKEEVSEAVKAEQKLVSKWYVLDTKGEMHPLTIKDGRVAGFDFEGHERLRKFATYEMAKSREVKEEPPHVRLMQEQELVDYEPGSDPGNLRYYPKGRLIKGLLEEFVGERVREYGAMEVECPVMYDFEHPALKSYLNRFPARQYVVQTPNKKAFLRFSACFGQFLIMKDMVLSYKQLPLSLYELTRYSFRAEQRGELAGLRRLRAFTMPDCHALVADVEKAMEHMMVRFELAWKLLQDAGFSMPGDFEAGLRVTEPFWKEHDDFVQAYANRWGKPILLEMWSEQFFYFVLKYEWNFVDANDKAAALTTDQIDTENAKRFGITFTDEKGEKRNPYILHLSPSGAIERVIYALLEKAAADIKAGKTPMLPVWLSPTQLRIVPVSNDQLAHARSLLSQFEGIRVDLDDTGDTLGKKIRRAEKEWVPYIAVIGRKETEAGTLNVRIRAARAQRDMTYDELRKSILAEVAGRPFRELAEPQLVSARPVFRG
ncbi:MAG: threonine--tRNA ligase [Candidatus Thermoplasmatota archaeon]